EQVELHREQRHHQKSDDSVDRCREVRIIDEVAGVCRGHERDVDDEDPEQGEPPQGVDIMHSPRLQGCWGIRSLSHADDNITQTIYLKLYGDVELEPVLPGRESAGATTRFRTSSGDCGGCRRLRSNGAESPPSMSKPWWPPPFSSPIKGASRRRPCPRSPKSST